MLLNEPKLDKSNFTKTYLNAAIDLEFDEYDIEFDLDDATEL